MSITSSTKRELILQTGQELFWKFGFRRVTIEEICKKAGISKMTYYKYFSNKLDLVQTIMHNVVQESMQKYKQIMSSDIPYPEKVTEMIRLKREQVETMSSEFFRDYLHSKDPEMIQFLQQLTRQSLQMFTDDFKKAQLDGDIRKDLKVEFILYIMNHMVEMSRDDNLLNLYDNPRELVMEITSFFFYGILNREKH